MIKEFILMSIAFSQAAAQWEVVGSDLIGSTFSDNTWSYSNTCGNTATTFPSQQGTCIKNNINFATIGSSPLLGNSLYTINNISPHYQVKIIMDAYLFIQTSWNNQLQVTINAVSSTAGSKTLQYKNSGSGANSVFGYQNDCDGTLAKFQVQTFVLPFSHNDVSSVQFTLCSSLNSGQYFGYRSLQLLINRCHWSCLKCESGSGSSNCRVCFSNPTTSLASLGSCAACPTNTEYIEFLDTNKGCFTECHYYRIPDSNKVCQFNENMLPLATYLDATTFTTAAPLSFIVDPLNFNLVNSERIAQIPCQATKSYVGPFLANEGYSVQLTLPSSLQYIRFRITILKFDNWSDYSSVRILLERQEVSQVYSLSQVLYNRNGVQLLQVTNCTSPTITYYRLETQIRTTLTNPTLYIMGNMDVTTSASWGFRHLVLDVMKCQSSCTSCDYDLKCYACSTGYLYKNRCVPQCPPYSTTAVGICTDYDESIANTQYLVKAFYDFGNTTDADLSTLFGAPTGVDATEFSTSDNFLSTNTKIYFSEYLGKRVLGGPLVWFKATFSQIYTLNYHYKIIIKFKVVLGDSFTGTFDYSIGGFTGSLSYSGGIDTTYNIGDTPTDRLLIVDRTESHTATANFQVSFTCTSQPSKKVDQQFCLLYDYYILVLECTQYCTGCTGPTWNDCISTKKLALPSTMSSPTACITNAYYLDTTVTPAICKSCTPTYCLECTSQSVCTLCATNFYLTNGQCLCSPSTYLNTNTCSNCSSYCKTCYGSSNTQCLSCIDSQHRFINNNQCICKNNYYDDGVNFICLSVCGDMVVTDGEDCDDGNQIRFDGCYQCKFECQKECTICVSGKCQACITGYVLHSTFKFCYPNCGDNLIVGIEQCEDGNITPYDGCYNCMYSCESICTFCVEGICQQCDQSLGYYINVATHKCETQCGDSIIVGIEQCDDGNNVPYDGCYNCFNQCDEACSICINGICQVCYIGFYYSNYTNKCETICGDNVVTFKEQCDDGNTVWYDGCYQCSFKCQDECSDCNFGVCLACGKSGYHLDQLNQICTSQCNDGVVTPYFEQCEDSNSLPEDGCYQCQYSCQAECLACSKGVCFQCKKEYYLASDEQCYPICGDGIIVQQEQCDDKNLIFEDGCSNCSFQCQKTCLICIFGVCSKCQQGYYLDSKSLMCFPICGDLLILGDEQCDTGLELIQKSQTGCVNCKYQCQSECDVCAFGICERCKQSQGWYLNQESGLCESMCGDWIISSTEQCDDNTSLNDGCAQCHYQCEENCQTCVFGQCLSCISGYYLQSSKCQSICGDGIVASDEDCDLGYVNFDGYICVNCKYKCQEGCSNCVKGQCEECQNSQGWYLNQVNQICYPQCGDSIINGFEMCDNETSQCQECQLVCDDSCLDCFLGNCQKCQIGYNLYDNQCDDVCGDLVITKNEQCDDGDLIKFDGCFECNYQCQIECIDCYHGQCIQCDEQSGWYLLNNRCQTFCGDGIQAGEEECDVSLLIDNGIVSFNKCFNCKFMCDSNCKECNQGICLNCQFGYYLQQEENYCKSYCGDQIRNDQIQETCEDDNLSAFDGCYSCQFDCVEKCKDCIYGVCLGCEKGYILDSNRDCVPFCGDEIVTSDENCDDRNNVEFDGCHQCFYSCPQFCNQCIKGKCHECETGYHLEFNYCESDCKDLVYNEEHTKCYLKTCQAECLTCYDGECLVCKSGWYVNQLNKNCESLCGDDKIVDLEQCDYFSKLETFNPKCNQDCQFGCPQSCKICNFGVCQKCLLGYQLINNECLPICGDENLLQEEQCDQKEEFDECFSCLRKCQTECQVCVQGICEQCSKGYELIDGKCFSICGDGYITKDEDCDDTNTTNQASCDQCKFQCDQHCKFCQFGKCHFCQTGFQLIGKNCVPICGDGIISEGEQCDDGNLQAEDGCFECQYSCQSQCQVCYKGFCFLCDESKGWNLKPQGICVPSCDDGIVSGNEQCDDGNDINYDGCFECKYICQKPCTKCLQGSCYECNTPGWKLDNFWCWEICGDGLVVGVEECDDGNDRPYDGCYDCKSQCDEACTICNAGVCKQCTLGWKLNVENRCEVNCGDSYVLQNYEDCDDGNLLPYDGCYECNYQCVQYCTLCIEGLCQECNTPGWQFQQETHLCIPVCGDHLVKGIEQCDDGNFIKFDGCSEICQFECHQACLLCDNGMCKECDRYNGYTEYNNQCTMKCGDGLWEPNTEQCDDGNNFNFDGCSENCEVEENWYCDNQQLLISNCIYRQQPNLQITLLTQKENKYTLSLTFTTKMKLDQNTQNTSQLYNEKNYQYATSDKVFTLKIFELHDNDYAYSFTAIQAVQLIPQNIQYILEIVIKNNIDLEKINLMVFVNNQLIVSENSVQLGKNFEEIQLPITFYIDPNEQRSLTYITDYQRFAIYATVSVTYFSIFTSGYSSFFMALDTIQYLFYSRYINLNFPNNLQVYFDGFKKASLTYAVEQVFKFSIFPLSQTENQELATKFSKDATLMTTTVIFGIYSFAAITHRLLNQIDPYFVYNLGSVVGGTIMTIMHKSQRILIDFFHSGTIRLVTINFYELTFASLLQISNMQIQNTADFFNVSSALITITLQFTFIGAIFYKIRQLQQKTTLNQKQSISTLFTHFEPTKQNPFWVSQYNTFLLLKKIFYIYLIVGFQQSGLFQSLAVSLQALIFSAYLYLASPLKNTNENKKALMTEVGMFINGLTFSVYALESYLYFNSEILYYFGWMNISVYTVVISFIMVVDSHTQLSIIYNKLKKLAVGFIESQSPSQSRIQPLFI